MRNFDKKSRLKEGLPVLLLSGAALVLSFFLLPAGFSIFEKSPRLVLSALVSAPIGCFILYFFIRKRNLNSTRNTGILLYLFGITALITAVMIFFEGKFRNSNRQPGVLVDYSATFFNVKDSIYLTNDFYADSNGIILANKEVLERKGWGIKQGYYINKDGFRSPEFLAKEDRDSSKTSILFLGDSFTWGSTAQPISNCFADIVEQQGYLVFNTGMQGADPAQYCAIAKKYIPLLKPDYCFLMFFEGNDIMWYDRKLVPYQPLFFYTSMGGIDAYKPDWLDGCPNEAFSDYLESYHYFIDNLTILGKNVSSFKHFCSQTVIATLWWRKFFKKEAKPCFIRPNKPVCTYYLDQIDSICSAHGVELKIFVIPDITELETDAVKLKERNPYFYGQYPIFVPPNLTVKDYIDYPDGHLNNSGHKKYGEYLLQQIRQFENE